MNTIIEKLKAEVERLKVDYLNRSYTFVPKAMQDLLDFLSDLEKECEKPTTAEGLEEEIDRFEDWMETYNQADYPTSFTTRDIARHFAKWGAEHAREQMMKEAVEGEVCGRVYDHINVRFADGVCKYLEPKNISHIPADVSKYKVGDKVRIIIVKEDK